MGLKPALTRLLPEDYGSEDITGFLVEEGDTVLLVMRDMISAEDFCAELKEMLR